LRFIAHLTCHKGEPHGVSQAANGQMGGVLIRQVDVKKHAGLMPLEMERLRERKER
jgi:hypothetical protein